MYLTDYQIERLMEFVNIIVKNIDYGTKRAKSVLDEFGDLLTKLDQITDPCAEQPK